MEDVAKRVTPASGAWGEHDVDIPEHSELGALYGSDVIADTLRALDIPYIALNPGASYRGLHDSLVNRLGNRDPQMLVCLHEEHAVALAHGYAKVMGRAMAVGLHANVGLMHASMAIFNAWCDRMPILLLGATGPLDAAQRRPWIEWIHTAIDQGALVRSFVKWDDQPGSPEAAVEALTRACWLANTLPRAPVYLNFDVELQEKPLDGPAPVIDPARYLPESFAGPSEAAIRRAMEMLGEAKRPVILAGRGSRSRDAWNARVALAEAFGAKVFTDLKLAAAFPTDHPLHCHSSDHGVIREADVILSLDWVDLAGQLKVNFNGVPGARIINVSMDHHIHNGWSMDYQGLPPSDLHIAADPDLVVKEIIERAGVKSNSSYTPLPPPEPFVPDGGPITVSRLASALRLVMGDRPSSLFRTPTGWDSRDWPFRDPLDYLGSTGGGGLGCSAGLVIGGALALREMGSKRIALTVAGDGDFLMGATALWTAVHYKIPALYVIANNCSYNNDILHQGVVANRRERNAANSWVGQRIDGPPVDLAQLARAQGASGYGPVTDDMALVEVLKEAIDDVERGSVALVDVRTMGKS